MAKEEDVVLGPAGALAWPHEGCSSKPAVAWSQGSGGILCGRTLLVFGLVFQTFPETATARSRVVRSLGTWAVKSDRYGGFRSQHCLLQADDLRQIALFT